MCQTITYLSFVSIVYKTNYAKKSLNKNLHFFCFPFYAIIIHRHKKTYLVYIFHLNKRRILFENKTATGEIVPIIYLIVTQILYSFSVLPRTDIMCYQNFQHYSFVYTFS